MSNSRVWISRVFTGVITAALLATAAMKFSHAPGMMEGVARAGIPKNQIIPLGILELLCLALYLAPRTMVLGAVLLTGYFGGAIVIHIIDGKSVFPVIMLGIWTWAGIYFRIPWLQELLPLRRNIRGGASTTEPATVRSTRSSYEPTY